MLFIFLDLRPQNVQFLHDVFYEPATLIFVILAFFRFAIFIKAVFTTKELFVECFSYSVHSASICWFDYGFDNHRSG